jgi:hypothetical protein
VTAIYAVKGVFVLERRSWTPDRSAPLRMTVRCWRGRDELSTEPEGVRALGGQAAVTPARSPAGARSAFAGTAVVVTMLRRLLDSVRANDGSKRRRALDARVRRYGLLRGEDRTHTAVPRWLLISAIALIFIPAQSGAQSTPDEYRLKAAFVYRFPQFVEWPPSALQEARTVDLCVLQPNPFGSQLEQLVTGESLSGLPLRVRVINTVEAIQGCHALFASARSEVAEAALKAVAGRPILTVGESDHFLDAGGIISLKVVDRRVRFDVSATNAQKAGLRISAQLLNLAATIRGGGL